MRLLYKTKRRNSKNHLENEANNQAEGRALVDSVLVILSPATKQAGGGTRDRVPVVIQHPCLALMPSLLVALRVEASSLEEKDPARSQSV